MTAVAGVKRWLKKKDRLRGQGAGPNRQEPHALLLTGEAWDPSHRPRINNASSQEQD